MKSTSKSILFSMIIRNLVRNKQRSILSASTIFIVIIFACLMSSLIVGQNEDMIANAINQVSGNIRIRNQAYSDNERVQPLQFFIPNTAELLTFIKLQDGVTGAEPHIRLTVQLYQNDEATTVSLTGLNFKTSRFFTDHNTKIIDGTIPTTNEKNAAVINPFMAKHFNLQVDDRFTILTRTAIGTNAVTVTVHAIATIGNHDFSGLNFFMDWELLSKKLRMKGNALEILIHTTDTLSPTKTENLIETIQNHAKNDSPLEIKKWIDINMIRQMTQSHKISNTLMSFFFTLMASTIIFNSTMMAVLERKKEIGTLMSLGMDAKHIKNLFLLESAILAFIASLSGILIGFICVHILGKIGIDMRLFGLNAITGFGISTWIYPNLPLHVYLRLLIIGTGTATIACIIPARMALKIQPADALRSAE